MFKNKRRNKNPIALILFTVILTVILFGIYSVYTVFFQKNPLFLSPVVGLVRSPADKIKDALIKSNMGFSNVVASDSAFLVFLNDKSEVLLSLDDNLEKKIYSLQLILKQFTIEDKKFKRIDFRFEKPTILFK